MYRYMVTLVTPRGTRVQWKAKSGITLDEYDTHLARILERAGVAWSVMLIELLPPA